MGNERTAAGTVDWTRSFYESVGKMTISSPHSSQLRDGFDKPRESGIAY